MSIILFLSFSDNDNDFDFFIFYYFNKNFFFYILVIIKKNRFDSQIKYRISIEEDKIVSKSLDFFLVQKLKENSENYLFYCFYCLLKKYWSLKKFNSIL